MQENINIKSGDIKVNTGDIKQILRIIGNIPEGLINNKDNSYIEHFRKKYIVMNEIRETEREYHAYAAKADKLLANEENLKFKKEVLEKYYSARNKRLELQEEIKEAENKYFWHLYI